MQLSTPGKQQSLTKNVPARVNKYISLTLNFIFHTTQKMVPSLIESIKVAGLVLVTDTSEDGHAAAAVAQRAHYRMPDGVDGILRGNGVLRFNEMIDM